MNNLPEGADLLRDLGEMDQNSVPAGLLKDHSLKQNVWGKLEMLEGSLRFVWSSGKLIDQNLDAGDVVVIPPEELHHLAPDTNFRLKLALYRAVKPA